MIPSKFLYVYRFDQNGSLQVYTRGATFQGFTHLINGESYIFVTSEDEANVCDGTIGTTTSTLPPTIAGATKLGDNIDGEAPNDLSGASVSLSDDGSRVAIGAYHNDGAGVNTGHVRIYDWSGSAWTQVGDDIDGENRDYSGSSVSLSADGSRVAIGAMFHDGDGNHTENDGSGDYTGCARIYEWSGSAWIQLGSDIDGEAAGDQAGRSISLSDDGSIVAIGSPFNDGNGDSSGHVRIFHWNGSSWNQLGSDIDGEAADDWNGWSVSLSGNGNTVAISAPLNDGSGHNSGHARIYSFDSSGWNQLGSDIDTEGSYNGGRSISLSNDGNRFAIGTTFASQNAIVVYEWSGSAWIQVGSNIAVNNQQLDINANNSWSVSLSSDGNRVAMLSLVHNDYAGIVNIFDWSGSAWTQVIGAIEGEAARDHIGGSSSNLSLSGDGNRVAIGAPANDDGGYRSGCVRVYQLDSIATPTTSSTTTTTTLAPRTSSAFYEQIGNNGCSGGSLNEYPRNTNCVETASNEIIFDEETLTFSYKASIEHDYVTWYYQIPNVDSDEPSDIEWIDGYNTDTLIGPKSLKLKRFTSDMSNTPYNSDNKTYPSGATIFQTRHDSGGADREIKTVSLKSDCTLGQKREFKVYAVIHVNNPNGPRTIDNRSLTFHQRLAFNSPMTTIAQGDIVRSSPNQAYIDLVESLGFEVVYNGAQGAASLITGYRDPIYASTYGYISKPYYYKCDNSINDSVLPHEFDSSANRNVVTSSIITPVADSESKIPYNIIPLYARSVTYYDGNIGDYNNCPLGGTPYQLRQTTSELKLDLGGLETTLENEGRLQWEVSKAVLGSLNTDGYNPISNTYNGQRSNFSYGAWTKTLRAAYNPPPYIWLLRCKISLPETTIYSEVFPITFGPYIGADLLYDERGSVINSNSPWQYSYAYGYKSPIYKSYNTVSTMITPENVFGKYNSLWRDDAYGIRPRTALRGETESIFSSNNEATYCTTSDAVNDLLLTGYLYDKNFKYKGKASYLNTTSVDRIDYSALQISRGDGDFEVITFTQHGQEYVVGIDHIDRAISSGDLNNSAFRPSSVTRTSSYINATVTQIQNHPNVPVYLIMSISTDGGQRYYNRYPSSVTKSGSSWVNKFSGSYTSGSIARFTAYTINHDKLSTTQLRKFYDSSRGPFLADQTFQFILS